MAKTQLIRKSFNAGELSPELHYRDDLAAYVKGCKKLTNMVPTPYGAVTRRPPFEVLSKIDTALYGVPVRYIPFKFSLTEVFHIVFTDGSGSESTDPTTADLIIFDELGTQVIFDGNAAPFSALPLTLAGTLSTQGIVAMATTVYDPADLHEMHYINVNDFVYLTCGGKYPVQAINRFFDKNEGGNRWKIEPALINGLMEDQNLEDSISLAVYPDIYDVNDTYPIDVAVSAALSAESINGTSWKFSHNDGFIAVYRLRITVAATSNYAAGDDVRIEGLEISNTGPINNKGGNQWMPQRVLLKASDVISGVFRVVSIENATQMIVNEEYGVVSGQRPQPTMINGTISQNLTGGTFDFYRSLQDGNIGNALSDTAWWEGISVYEGEVNLESSYDLFTPTDVGRQMSIEAISKLDGDWNTTSNTSDPIVAQGVFTLKTEGGSWDGNLQLQESLNGGGTWNTIKTITSVHATNGSVEVEISDINTMLRVVLDDFTAPSPGNYVKEACVWTLTPSAQSYNYYTISEFIDAKTVKAETINPMFNRMSGYRWSLGVFSDTTGYPFSLTIHDERMVYAGCRKSPNTIYSSRVNDWSNFLKGFSDVAPYTFTIASDSFDTVRSIKSSRQLNILTDNQEVTMGSREDNAITSVSNIAVSSHTNYGSNETQAIQLADMIWFVMGQGERVRASKYDFASDGQQSMEMSLFASHITESGIKEMSFRRHPFNSLFCLLNNGTGAVLTYEGTQEVKAWATVKTEGNIISAASNYSDTGDIIAGVVERNGSYFLEQFGEIDTGTVFLDNQTTWTDANFDLGQPIEQDDDGNLVVILDDTELVRDVDYTIAGGVLTIPSQLTGDVCIGRRIECRVNPTDISEVAPSGMVKRLTELGMYLLDSGTCNVEINGKPSPFTDGLKWVAGQRESGLFELTTGGDYEQGLDVNITIDGHRHFTLTGLGYRLGISQG